jgi:hypothetical protein
MRLLGRPSNRHGISLVEMLVYIACLTIFLSVISVAMWRLWTSHAQLNERASGLMKILNSGELWRDDVRGSESVPLLQQVNGYEGVLLERNGRKFDYRVVDGELHRVENGQVEILAKNIVSSKMMAETRNELIYLRWEVEVRLTGASGKTQAFTFMAVPFAQREKR